MSLPVSLWYRSTNPVGDTLCFQRVAVSTDLPDRVTGNSPVRDRNEALGREDPFKTGVDPGCGGRRNQKGSSRQRVAKPSDTLAGRMSTSPSISVVVPFYNSEHYIGACINSLSNQLGVGGNYELIFVNNRSTDDSVEMVEQADGIELLTEDTTGAYAARNTGIRKARAPLIAFTDSDCVADSDWLRSIQATMKDPALAILVGDVRYPSRASLALRILGAYENAKIEHVIHRCPRAQHFAYADNMAVRASVFDELGLFQQWERAADTELVHRQASRRPDQRLAYCRTMRITHLEILTARERAKRLLLYSRTNAKIGSFKGLGLSTRIAVLRDLFRQHHTS